MDDGNGNVKGIKTMKVEWTKDKAGRWNMADVPGTSTHLSICPSVSPCLFPFIYSSICLSVNFYLIYLTKMNHK